MTPLQGLIFLVGLIAVPLWLLVVGHGLRTRGRRARGAFWGVASGYLTASLALSALLILVAPVGWPPLVGRWTVALLVPGLALVGGAAGTALGRAPRVRRRETPAGRGG